MHSELSEHSRFSENVRVVVEGRFKELSLPDCLHPIPLSSCPPSRKQEKLLTSLHAPPHRSSASSEIRLSLLIFLVALLCGAVFFCLQCWLRRPQMGSPRRTMTVFAVGDLDPVYGTEAAVNPPIGIHLQTQNRELYPVSCFGTLGPPPPYEEILKSSRF
ncbi:transmembrane protein 207 [Diceros bicornis minor]|uniref:transmembrane protein 207 n=1 Tax=Diceros bicornis minor TaxID=77932 RepID=UPI0026ECA1FF|nr:transmembrane protein 207 [Diceros bicornis minor]